MRCILSFLSFLFLAKMGWSQNRISIVEMVNSPSSKVYQITFSEKQYHLQLTRIDEGKYDSLDLWENNLKLILKTKIRAEISMNVRAMELKSRASVLIEVSSNVLTVHKIEFGEKVRFIKAKPLTKVEMAKYYESLGI